METVARISNIPDFQKPQKLDIWMLEGIPTFGDLRFWGEFFDFPTRSDAFNAFAYSKPNTRLQLRAFFWFFSNLPERISSSSFFFSFLFFCILYYWWVWSGAREEGFVGSAGFWGGFGGVVKVGIRRVRSWTWSRDIYMYHLLQNSTIGVDIIGLLVLVLSSSVCWFCLHEILLWSEKMWLACLIKGDHMRARLECRQVHGDGCREWWKSNGIWSNCEGIVL